MNSSNYKFKWPEARNIVTHGKIHIFRPIIKILQLIKVTMLDTHANTGWAFEQYTDVL